MALELEHVATADRRTLAAWGFSEHSRSGVNWGIEQLTLILSSATAGTDAPLWAYRDKLVLWSGTTRILHCWVTTTGHAASDSREAQPYILSGPGWWLDNTPFNDTSDSGYVDQTAGINNQLNYLLLWAISAGAPIDVGTLALAGLSPAIGTGHTVLSAMQQVARFSPLSYGGWDHSGEVPAFNAALRADLTPVSLALFGGHVGSWDIRPRPDMQLHRVRIIYTAPNPTPGYENDPFEYPDIAGDPDWPSGPGFLELTVPCETVQEAADAASGSFDGTTYQPVAASLHAALSALCHEGTVQLSGALEDFPNIRPGQALNLTGGSDGAAAWATMAAPIQQVEYSGNAAADTCTITLGLPTQLGVQDYLELYRLASGGANGAGRPYPPPAPTPDPDPTPGTLEDLNGGGAFPNGEILGALAVEKIALTGDLVGRAQFSPFATTPPQFYRSGTLSGTAKYYPTLDGSGVPVIEATASGSWRVADDGSFDQSASLFTSNNGNPPKVVPAVKLAGMSLGSWDTSCPAFSTSATSAYLVFRPGPNNYSGYGPGADGYCPQANDTGVTSWMDMGVYPMSSAGSLIESMGSEDTEAALIARKSAVASWQSATVADIASYPARTTGRTVSFEKLRWRITRSVEGVIVQEVAGLRPLWWYDLTVVIERSLVGVQEWADVETRKYLLTPDMSGVAATPNWDEITPERGYEYRIKSWAITP